MKDVIQHCFNEHSKDLDDAIKFTYEEYEKFWLSHNTGDNYRMKNRDGSYVFCKIAYYPLPYYPDLRALIEIERDAGVDLRDVPVCFLEKI